ncbi:hypothetical protein OUZ56_016930 [Daphnia magna]|uniref:Uncharacterized protein n=1 Tax=Daphnia magna TaxID=35525 RepID=A0ABR0ARP7_9CRUS|nr:hypothetical protein OUZ56_016930 [Daphnia magna]
MGHPTVALQLRSVDAGGLVECVGHVVEQQVDPSGTPLADAVHESRPVDVVLPPHGLLLQLHSSAQLTIATTWHTYRMGESSADHDVQAEMAKRATTMNRDQRSPKNKSQHRNTCT